MYYLVMCMKIIGEVIMKLYILCLLTLAGCSSQASAPASSSSSTGDSNKVLNESLKIAMDMGNDEKTAANVTRLLDSGARFEGDPSLFSTPQKSFPIYANSPKTMQALINHPSTFVGSTLWHNLQNTFIRADMDDLKELAVNPKFDINYFGHGQDALSHKVALVDLDETAYDRALFLRVMDMREMNNTRNKAHATIASLEEWHDNFIFDAVRNSAQSVLNALAPQTNVYSLLTSEQSNEYNSIKIKRELGGQNVLSFLKNRQMGAPFAKTQQAIAEQRKR